METKNEGNAIGIGIENPFTLKVGQVFTGFGIGCGVGIGVGRPLNLAAIPMLNQVMSATRGATDAFSGVSRHVNTSPGFEGRNCIADEHYLPTFFQIVDPGGIANWSVTHVDWSERKWHPKSYRAEDVTYQLLKNITSVDVSVHVTSDEKKEVQSWPCLWNGMQKPCYLFARKFTPETLDTLLHIFSNYSAP